MTHDSKTGISLPTVHGFMPEDFSLIARKLLARGGQQVNKHNLRSYRGAMSLGQSRLARGERDFAENQVALTRFRQGPADIDFQASGEVLIGSVIDPTGQLAAARALQRARDRALCQQLNVVQVVDANLPVKSEYPRRFRILATVFVSLLPAYSIGWLIAAGVREHAA